MTKHASIKSAVTRKLQHKCDGISVSGALKIWQRGAATEGLGAWPPTTHEFRRFSREKTLILAHFFIEKEHAVGAVTAKLLSRLMSKSRSLVETSKAKTTAWILKKMSDFNRADTGATGHWTDLER